MRRFMTLALAAAAVALLASSAQAKPKFTVRKGVNLNKQPAAASGPSTLKVEAFDIKRVTWPQVELSFGGLESRGGRVEEQITVWFVDGARRHNLFRRKVKFTNQRGGFPTSLTVNLNGKAVHRGQLEVTIDACAHLPQCKQSLRLQGGDLVVDGRPAYRSIGREKELQFDIKNAGPNAAGTCEAVLEVDGRALARQPVSSLQRNAKQPVKFRYDSRYKDKDAKVKLTCTDLAPTNNERRLRLR
ncbi:MAG: hypothetical protein KC613_18910 [Myxococcales bacterium]|nr:hypothetical protein [Myxococcales bacterium]MCB9523005.1 hypothetical protein [Myxococcales bacterium]